MQYEIQELHALSKISQDFGPVNVSNSNFEETISKLN